MRVQTLRFLSEIQRNAKITSTRLLIKIIFMIKKDVLRDLT